MASPVSRAVRLSRRIPLLAIATAALVTGTGFAGGGYFPSSWGWPLLAAGWAGALALLLDRDSALGALGAATSALLLALVGWTTLSAIWSLDVTQTVLEAERTGIYAAVVLAALLWGRRSPQQLVYGVWAGAVVVSGWGLVTRLVPDRFGVVDLISGYRLSEPIGYWNALGLLAAIGSLLALGFASGRSTARRALGGASLPILVTTLFFTYGRGAWVALGAGLIAMLALDRRRLDILITALAAGAWCAIAVSRAATYSALTTLGSPISEMARQGHRLAVVVAVTAVGAGAACAAIGALTPAQRLSPRTERGIWGAIAVMIAAGLAALFVLVGTPPTLAHRLWNGFSSGSVQTTGSLNERLFHLSGNGRVKQWHVAWRVVEAHPALGTGAGTYEIAWFRQRPVAVKVRDAHSLYLETLAELGPTGLLLLLGVLALPILAAVRVRKRIQPLSAAAFGAYIAYLVHVAVDWDWEVPTVTLAALLCGAAMLVSDDTKLGPWRRGLLIVPIVLIAAGLYTLATQIPLSHLRSDAAKGRWAAAEHDASQAARVAPWSSEPWTQLGRMELAAGRIRQAHYDFVLASQKSPHEWNVWLDLARVSTGSERANALAQASRLDPIGPEVAALRKSG